MVDAVTDTVNIECDFFEDVQAFFTEALRPFSITLPAGGEAPPITTRAKTAATEYFHLQHRLIEARPRRVVWSTVLQAGLAGDPHRLAVEAIASELETGVDVRPRMTKALRTPGYNDGLLTDWGIYHLHLGPHVLSDGFVQQADPLLFVFIAGEAAYLLDRLDHKAFQNQQLFEIIHENWPEVIASWRPPGFVHGPSAFNPTPAHRKELRKKFAMLTEMQDGTIYVPPGGGVVTSGHSLLAVRRANALLSLVRPAEDWVHENADLICTRIEQLTGVRPARLRLQFQTALTLAMGRAVVWETTTRAEILPGGPEPIVGILSGAA